MNRDDAEACNTMESAAHDHAQCVINRIEELFKEDIDMTKPACPYGDKRVL